MQNNGAELALASAEVGIRKIIECVLNGHSNKASWWAIASLYKSALGREFVDYVLNDLGWTEGFFKLLTNRLAKAKELSFKGNMTYILH